MVCVFCVVLILLAGNAASGKSYFIQSVEEAAVKSVRPQGAPKYSDVCMSSRWKHPKNENDKYDTLRDAAAFHATRIEWCYSFDARWIKQVKEQGYFYGGTLNANLADDWPDETVPATYRQGRIQDKKGKSITAPWMSMWEPVPYWGCVNSPQYRDIYLKCAKFLIDAGVDAIQTDDPACNIGALKWGGCFCEHCVSKAAIKYVDLEDAQQLEEFTNASVQKFFEDMQAQTKKAAARPVGFSSNNFGGRWNMPYNLFDYGIAEYEKPTPESLFELSKYIRSIGKAQVITLRNESVSINRKTIALCYATGMNMLCPYDVYLRSTPQGSDRLFIEPSKVADIYGFARANAEYLDDYEDAAATGGSIRETRYDNIKPMEVLYKGVYGFVRAKPGRGNEPVVVHLLDWISAAVPFDIRLNNDYFFPGKTFVVKVLLPVPYDQKLHQAANDAKDYSLLRAPAQVNVVNDGKTTTISIPPLNPWAIVVLTPETKQPNTNQ